MQSHSLLAALVVFVSLTVVLTHARPAIAPADNCGQYICLPGIDAMGVGFDLVQGKSNFVPVISFSYNNQKLYQNAYNSSLVYMYPDQAAVADYNSYDVASLTFSSATEYSDYLAEAAGVQVHVGAAFSLSADWSYVNDVTETQGNTYCQTQQLFTLYQVELQPSRYLTSTSMFRDAVSRLPKTYSENIYSEFVQYFGTHYVSQALYGGKATVKTNVQKGYADNNSPFVTAGNAKLYFSNLKNGGGGSYSYPQPTADWLSNAATETELIGGNPFIPLSQWSQWIDSIKEAPAQVSYRLASITDLINDTVIQNNMMTYINSYYAANSHSAPPLKPAWVKLGPCNCYAPEYNDYNGCEAGSFIIGSEEDGGGLPVAPPMCCTPCYSFGPTGSFDANNASLAVVMEEQMEKRAKIISDRRDERNKEELEAILRGTPNTASPGLCGSNPCLPGLSSMGIGLDIITGRLKSQPIISYTFQQNNQWTNPFTNKNYNYPDQVVVVDSSTHDVEVYTFESITQYGSYLAYKAGISGTIGSFFSGSLDVISISNIFSDNLAILGLTSQLATIYEVTLAPAFLLTFTDLFTQMVAELPETFDEAAYSNFVSYFGTHMVTQALYGGEAVMKTAIDQHYFGMYDQSYIQTQLGIQYQMFQLGVNFWRNHTQSFGEFLNSSFSECHLLGGNYEDFNINDWDNWVESIGNSPVQVRYQLAELSTFISDAQKSANLATYINNYIVANNHTMPPVPKPPPMTTCNYHTVNYMLENCNQTNQLTSAFDNLFIENGTPYFGLPQNCGTPCYKGGDMPDVQMCGCYVEQNGVSFCTQLGYFVAGYANWYKSFGTVYPAVPPVCCRPCYETHVSANGQKGLAN